MTDSVSSAISFAKRLDDIVQKERKWRTEETLNLIASENFASDKTRSYLASDFSNRYTAPDRFYRGTRYADELKELAEELACKVYRAKYAEVSALSGHTCSLIVFMALLKRGDSIISCDPKDGGYPGSSRVGLAPLLGIRNLYFPFDRNAMNIIPAKTRGLITKRRPKLTIFGASYILFPYDIRSTMPDDYDGYTIYDGSHVMGLIAGGQFQDPLREGCSLLMGSTHKTLFGPQGGLMVSNDEEVFNEITGKIFPGIVDNIHLNRIAGLAHSLAELLKFGKDYSNAVIRNSQALAKCLDDLGVNVKAREYGFTKSHQILLDYERKRSLQLADSFQLSDIITDVELRLGTAEVTRRGMKESQMEEIAHLIQDVIEEARPTTEIRNRVHKLVKEFRTLEFSL